MYCKSVREIHTVLSNRCLDILYDDDLREAIRDCICMFMEFDNAYRFRLQDILPEMNKVALKENPLKELARMMDLLIEREIHEPGKVKMADKWKMAKELICLFLRFNRPILEDIKQILLRINLKEIELTLEDRYFCEFRADYRFGFMIKGCIKKREIPKGLPIQASPQVEQSIK